MCETRVNSKADKRPYTHETKNVTILLREALLVKLELANTDSGCRIGVDVISIITRVNFIELLRV